MPYVFSPKKNAFYPISLKTAYVSAGTWPDDAVQVEDNVYNEFFAFPPAGKTRLVGADGLPMWGDIKTVEKCGEHIKARARALRNDFISCTDKLFVDDYTIDNITLSDERRSELLKTRAAFKSWPDCSGWPEINLPDIPQWLLVEAINNGYVVCNWPE